MEEVKFDWKYKIGVECVSYSPRRFKEVDGKLIECVKVKTRKRKKKITNGK